MNIMEYTDITRPRRWSGTMDWISVFEEDICNIMQNPTGTRRIVESQKFLDTANAMREMPKPPQENVIQRPSP